LVIVIFVVKIFDFVVLVGLFARIALLASAD
jgi:hypothetical protein